MADNMTTDEWMNGELTKKEDGYYIEGEDECVLYHHEREGIKKGVELLCKEYEFESVLEFGFGKGWTATEFQEQGVKRHVIIEPNIGIYKSALGWNKNHNAEILNMFSWEYEPKEKFDLVYDDILEFGNTSDRHHEYINNFKDQWYARCMQRKCVYKNTVHEDPYIDYTAGETEYRQVIRKL
tara:strand:- start:270 stop:815 length:546 start_codon:yes stop_codon:yes gene_type:complete